MRNTIYELSFTNDDSDSEVDLALPKPPTKSLLLTSRQAYTEANQIYKKAYRKYWSTTKFVCEQSPFFDKHTEPANDYYLKNLRDDDIEQICHLRVVCFFKENVEMETELVDLRGGWCHTPFGVYPPAVNWVTVTPRREDRHLFHSSEEMKECLSGAQTFHTRRDLFNAILVGNRL